MNNNESSMDEQDVHNAAPLTDATVRLVGHDGNAFAILGRVRRGILNSNHPELVEAFMKEAVSDDYDFLLQTCLRYVTVE